MAFQALLDLDWRSSYEFQGFLTRVLEGSVDEASALKGWYNEAEKSWLYYIVGLLRFRQGDWAESERLLREAVLAADTEGWEYYVARARLEQLQKMRRKSLKSEKQRDRRHQSPEQQAGQGLLLRDARSGPL